MTCPTCVKHRAWLRGNGVVRLRRRHCWSCTVRRRNARSVAWRLLGAFGCVAFFLCGLGLLIKLGQLLGGGP